MKLNDRQIKEIAELLDSGMTCFYHRPTGKIDYHPDINDPYFDPEPWQDTMNKIKSDRDNYERFVKMESYEGFRVMENFAHSLSDEDFKIKLLNALSKRKPFQNFKDLIDRSDCRQDWFDFKYRAYINYVKQQIEI